MGCGARVRGAAERLAVDLECGSGFQSLALHELGYRVLALDPSEKLLGKGSGHDAETWGPPETRQLWLMNKALAAREKLRCSATAAKIRSRCRSITE